MGGGVGNAAMPKVGRRGVEHNRCSVCGRRLYKSFGIGPVCAAGKKRRKISKKTYIKLLKKREIFKENGNEPGEDERAS